MITKLTFPTRLSKADLADLNSFLVVFRTQSFTRAAIELGLTTSALSHSIRNLESRLGVRLLNRTSRTVSPTDAGTGLANRLEIGFHEISSAIADVNRHRDKPAGKIRLNVLSDGARMLLAKRLPKFLETYPDVSVEVAVNDRMLDIVASGFDAGIRFGGTVPDDYVALRIGSPLRWVAVASPRYLNLSGPLKKPEDLLHHRCIQIRTGDDTVYRWEFMKDEVKSAIDVPGQLCVNETTLGVEMALSHVGVFYCLEDRIADYVNRGSLQIVLPEWAPIEPAFYLYYPGHRQPPSGLMELVDCLKSEL